MKIVSVVGARPQFVKAAVVSPELRKAHHEVLVHTGQHYDFQMSQVFFDELVIPEPDYNLGIGSGTHATQTARMMVGIEDVLLKENPDMVLVYGDTNSTLAAAITASKMHLPVAHVEAGPRMFDMNVPEEVNRILTDHLSTLLFAPTQTSVQNLSKESLVNGVHFTGDVMLDAFLRFAPLAQRKSTILHRLNVKHQEYMYVTAHRAHNTDDPVRLRAVVAALMAVECRLVMPVHPRTSKCLESAGLWTQLAESRHVILCEPVSYLDSLMLTISAQALITDSGGLQREAYFASVPCITLDRATPWPETVTAGWNTLVGTPELLTTSIQAAPRTSEHPSLFGPGHAARTAVGLLDT